MNINEIFTYNQHFVAMMNVINAARLNPPESGHKHHIIPRCWFTMNNLPIDNSKENLVLLTYEDHCKVHKLMYLCAKDDVMKSKLAFAVHRLNGGTFSGLRHTDESKEKNRIAHLGKSNAGYKLTDEQKKKISERSKGRTGYWKDKKLSDDTKMKLSESHKGKSCTEDTKKKMSASHKGKPSNTKGKSWKLVDGKRIYYMEIEHDSER